MIITTRRIGKKLIIGDNTEVMVLGIKGNQARFGITAPAGVSVHREEDYQRMLLEQKRYLCINNHL